MADDFIGSFIDRLTEFGVQPPSVLAKAAEDVAWSHHTIGHVLAAIWPLNFWRSDVMGPADFEWFENHYPGWHEHYGGVLGGLPAAGRPLRGHLMLQELPGLPPFCQVCQLPASCLAWTRMSSVSLSDVAEVRNVQRRL